MTDSPTTPTDAELDALVRRLDVCAESDPVQAEAIDALAALRRERDAAMDVNFRVLRRAKSAERQVETLRRERDEVVALAENAEARRTEVALQLNEAKRQVETLREALKEAIEGWEDGAAYKGEYLREKHGDAEGIAKARAALAETEKMDG